VKKGLLFVNKKKQKNFDSRWRFQHHAKRRKSFLVLFFKKERLTLASSGLPLSSDSVLLVSVKVAGHGSVEQDGRTAGPAAGRLRPLRRHATL